MNRSTITKMQDKNNQSDKKGLRLISSNTKTAFSAKLFSEKTLGNQFNPNRYKTDHLENEARHSAETWRRLNGCEHVSRPIERPRISQTTAASYSAATSTAETLPQDLQQNLEYYFNADLSVVRVHRDVAAAKVTEKENARAFTAGNNIYFAEGQYQPNSKEGQELLAHEITHVLQQTARASHEGRLRATQSSSNAEIQRDALFDELVSVYRAEASKEPPNPVEPTSKQQRETGLESAISIIKNITGANEVLDTTVGSTEVALLMEKAVLGDTSKDAQALAKKLDMSSWVTRGFVYDCFKMLGRYDGAAKLLDNEHGIQTYLRYRLQMDSQLLEFENHLIASSDYGENWIQTAMKEVKVNDSIIWPYNLVQNIWTYLTRPARLAKRSRDYHDLYTNYLLKYGKKGFGANERELIALQKIDLYDDVVYKQMKKFDTSESIADQVPTEKKKNQAAGMIDFGKRIKKLGSVLDVIVGDMIIKVSKIAFEFWERAYNLTMESVKGEGFSDLIGPPPNIKILNKFIKTVTDKGLELLFTLDDQKPLWDQPDYEEKLQGFRSEIESYLGTNEDIQQPDTIEHYLEWNLFRSEHVTRKNRREESIDRAIWLAWAIKWIELLILLFDKYDKPRDEKFMSELNSDEIRLEHRYIIASFLNSFGLTVRDKSLIEKTDKIVSGDDFGKSYLLITGDWQQDEKAEVSALDEDFSNATVKEYGLLTNQIVRIFELIRMKEFNDVLERTVLANEGDIDTQQEFTKTAAEKAKAVPMPTRWTNTNYRFVWHYNKGEELADSNARALIIANPGYQKFVSEHRKNDGKVIIPRGHGRSLIVWKIPTLQPLIKILISITELKNFIINTTNLSKDVSDKDWFMAFVYIVEEGMDEFGEQPLEYKERRQEIMELINSGLINNILSETARQNRMLRRATTHHRRVLVKQLNPFIQTYIDGDLSDYGKPNEAKNHIETFVLYVLPKVPDTQAQETALALGVAEKLRDMFITDTFLGTIREKRYDLVTGYYDIVARAIEYTDSNVDDILHVLFIPENLNDDERAFHKASNATYEDATALLDNKKYLIEVKNSLDTVIATQQEKTGFESVDGNHIKSLNFAHEFKLKEPIIAHNKEFSINEIGQPFRYHPPYSEKIETGKSIVRKPNGDPFPENALLLKFQIGTDEEIAVYNKPGDMHHMERLSIIVALAGFVASLDALEKTILEAAELGLDILEFVPGVGQGVMAARALYAVTVFVVEDLPNIQTELFENPSKILDEIKTVIDADFSKFALFLLFERLPFEDRLSMPDTDEEDDKRKRGKKGTAARLTRLFDFVKDMLEYAMRAFLRVRGRTLSAFVRSQGRILANPKLRQVVEMLPVFISVASNAGEIDKFFKKFDATERETIKSDLKGEFENILNAMAEMEIPKDIIPLELAVSVLLNFSLEKLPGKKGKIIARLLEATGAVDAASDLIADKLENTELNPNKYWKEHAQDKLQTKLNTVRSELFTNIATFINTATDGKIVLGTPNLNATKVTSDDTKPETEPLLPKLIDTKPGDDTLPEVEYSSGIPLTKSQRQLYFNQFGHNFSHVRLHTNQNAQALTDATHAYALTSGSHIFLNRRVALESEFGQAIMRHELAHVLQQTGSRARGRYINDTPLPGQGESSGLQYDVAREAAADRMALMAKSRDYEDEPLAVLESGGDGWLPSMQTVAAITIEKLLDDDLAENQAKGFETSVPAKLKRKATFKSAVTDARNIWKRIKKRFDDDGAKLKHEEPFDKAKAELKVLMNSSLDGKIKENIVGITAKSLKDLNNGRVRLKASLFVNNLETYIFSLSGVLLNIDVDNEQVDTVKVANLYLPLLGVRTSLWQKLKTNTENNMPTGMSVDDKKMFAKKAWTRIKDIIKGNEITEALWERDNGQKYFRLGTAFINEFMTILKNLDSIKGKLEEWETDYIKPTANSRAMGLRVGTHNQMTKNHTSLSLKGARQSHHVPQYLLVEYFRNNANSNLFSDTDERLPGFYPHGTGATKNLTHYSDAVPENKSDKTIDFKKYDPNDSVDSRGDGLPAMSVAKATHQLGKLHINSSSNWGPNQDSTGTATQGQILDRWFVEQLNLAGLPGSKKEIRQRAQVENADLGAIKGKVYIAMKSTYSKMYDFMIKQVPPALKHHEINFYHDVAKLKHDKEDVDDLPVKFKAKKGDIDTVMANFKVNINTIMQNEWGAR